MGLWIAWWIIKVRPILSLAWDSHIKATQWRDRWMRLEQESKSLCQQVADGSLGLRREKLFEAAPVFPAHVTALYGHTSIPLMQIVRGPAADPQESAEILGTIHSLILLECIKIGKPVVVGRADVDGRRCLCACWMLASSVQAWMRLFVIDVGGALCPQMELGYQWWLSSGVLRDGEWYRGDVFRAKARMAIPGLFLGGGTTGWMPLAMAAPIAGLLLMLGEALAVTGFLFRGDRRSRFLAVCDPAMGDSADYRILVTERHRTPTQFGVELNANALSEYEAVKQRLVVAAQEALSRMAR